MIIDSYKKNTEKIRKNEYKKIIPKEHSKT